MSLLVDMTASALEPSYADAAARRSGSAPVGPGPVRTHRTSALFVGVLVLLGLVTGIAAAQVRQDADRIGSLRASLVQDVRRQTRETDELASTAGALRDELATVRARVLGQGDRGREIARGLNALELVTGGIAVRGPGLVVTLDDATDAASGSGTTRGGQLGDGRVYDRDVQDVVNALWEVGAEAISVNDQRLTARTAIRSAGEAVLVDFRPLTPPYIIRAVGDVEKMEPEFADGATARRLHSWTSLYGLGFAVARAEELRLPAAPEPDLRSVEQGGGG